MCACGLHCSVGVTRGTATVAGMEKAWCGLAQVVGMMEAVGMCACGLQCSVGVTRVIVTVAGTA